jgi:hypothetical protein
MIAPSMIVRQPIISTFLLGPIIKIAERLITSLLTATQMTDLIIECTKRY